MTKSFLSVRGFQKRFGEVVAVEDVNLEIAEGEFLTFLGPSGSGKSTTLYAVAGFEDPTSGDILLRGSSILNVPSHKRNIGMVFQRYTLFPHLTVGENVAFPLRVRKQPEAEIKVRVAEMLSLVRLEGFTDRMPGQLSGGQQQRVALARALAYKPPVLLMDEPLSALDKKLREEIQIELRRIHRETGVTILYVTHDQEEALRLSDRIAVFSKGRVEQVADGKTLYEAPASRFVAGFVGDSNFLRLKACQVKPDGRCDAVFPDGTQIRGLRHINDAAAAEGIELMVRPQFVQFESKRASDNALPVVVRDATFLGDKVSLQLETRWGELFWSTARSARGAPVEIGSSGSALFASENCFAFSRNS